MALEQVPVKNPISFANVKGYLGNLTDKFLMKPKNVAGIAGWVFDYDAETHIDLQAEITDHFVEDNTAIQDHIAIRPIRMTLRGYVGELVFQPSQALSILNAIQSRLTEVPAFLGPLTPGGLNKVQNALTKVINVQNQVNELYNKAKNLYGFFANSSPAVTKQQKAFSHFMAAMNSRVIMVINTPYGSFDHMVIEHVSMTQDENTQFWSDVSITLKQINTVPIEVSPIDKNTNRNSIQSASTFKKGVTKGLGVARTTLDFFFN